MRHKNRGRRSLSEKSKKHLPIGTKIISIRKGYDGNYDLDTIEDYYYDKGLNTYVYDLKSGNVVYHRDLGKNFERLTECKNRGRRSLSEKRQINEGNFIPKEDFEREIEKEWSKIAGEKVIIEISGDYDIDDYAVYAFGSELATLRLFHYWTYYQPKPLDRNGYAKYTKGLKGSKFHYFMIWDYADD